MIFIILRLIHFYFLYYYLMSPVYCTDLLARVADKVRVFSNKEYWVHIYFLIFNCCQALQSFPRATKKTIYDLTIILEYYNM